MPSYSAKGELVPDGMSQNDKREIRNTNGAIALRNKLAEMGGKTRNFLTQRTDSLRKPETKNRVKQFAKKVAGNIQRMDKKSKTNSLFSGGAFSGKNYSSGIGFRMYKRPKKGFF